MEKHLINNKYEILNKIGEGSFGSIYRGKNIRTNEYVAIKAKSIKNKIKMLKNKSNIYMYLNGYQGIPQIKWFGKDENYYYMVINLLGLSLQTIRQNYQSFSLTLVLKIGIQIVNILLTLHDKGFIHRDIKPDNFLFDINKSNQIYLIDFGICKRYINESGNHIKEKNIYGLIGSNNYTSIYSHEKMELSRRDDLKSLFYVLLFLYYGKLEWSNENEKNIIQSKRYITENRFIPEPLLNFIKYIRRLRFEERPNYIMIIESFAHFLM